MDCHLDGLLWRVSCIEADGWNDYWIFEQEKENSFLFWHGRIRRGETGEEGVKDSHSVWAEWTYWYHWKDSAILYPRMQGQKWVWTLLMGGSGSTLQLSQSGIYLKSTWKSVQIRCPVTKLFPNDHLKQQQFFFFNVIVFEYIMLGKEQPY